MIKLDFGSFSCTAELFDIPVAQKLELILPVTIDLISWGNELYGSVNTDLGEDKLVAKIPSGGLAYTRRGDYLCIFFGQDPAWEVEHIGSIINDQWKELLNSPAPSQVVVSKMG